MIVIRCPEHHPLGTVAASPLFYRDPEDHIARGMEVRLRPGFVAKRLHASGVPWYIPGRNPVAPSPKVRANRPFVITCDRCGADVPVDVAADVLGSSE